MKLKAISKLLYKIVSESDYFEINLFGDLHFKQVFFIDILHVFSTILQETKYALTSGFMPYEI